MIDFYVSAIKLYGALKTVICYSTRVYGHVKNIVTMKFSRECCGRKIETWVSSKTCDTRNTEQTYGSHDKKFY